MANVKLLEPGSYKVGDRLILEDDPRANEQISLSLVLFSPEENQYYSGKARVLDNTSREIEIEILDLERMRIHKYITLVLGACRPQMLKRIFEASTSFPIKKIIIVACENSEKSYLSSRLLRESDYLKYMKKGVEQSGIPFLPEVQVIDKFWSLLKNRDVLEVGSRYFCDGTESRGLGVASGDIEEEAQLVLAVGPESGWSKRELEYFREFGFEGFSLGGAILRVDVAVISALSILNRDVYRK